MSDWIVFFENNYIPLSQAKIGILTHAFHYGTGVFEGIRGYWDADAREVNLFRPLEHYARWRRNASILRMALSPTAIDLTEITAELVRRNGFEANIYIRPLVYKSAQRVGVCPDEKFDYLIAAMPFGAYLDTEHGIHAGIVSWRRIEDTAIPGRAKICGAYVNSALASEEARLNGFDEGIFLTESGHVAEGAAANLFMVRDGKLITPPPSDNILEGITRASLIELAHDQLALPVVERSIDRSELYICDELFLTGTAVELSPVTRIDHRPVGLGEIGPLTRRLRQVFSDATHGRLPAYRKWLVPSYQHVLAGLPA
ncbi:MAG: branched-chain amino acid transaminase [Bryobacterales bacterium]|nr:branched-chain amino acid transaminase [Bryobacterales bacterium]